MNGSRVPPALAHAAYFGMLAALFFVGGHPVGRVFGFDAWAGLSIGGRVVLAIAGLVAWALAVSGLPDRLAASMGRAPRDLVLVIAFVAATAFASVKFPTLGDGFQSLALLGADPPVVKGTAPLPAALLPALAGPGGPALAYRVLAVASGAAAAFAVVLGARRLVAEPAPRLAFAAALLLSGASLVFFGYVENYGPLVAAVMGFTVLGAAAARLPAGADRGLCLAASGAGLLAIASHAFGIAVLPALAWLWLRRTRGLVPAAGAFVLLLGAGAWFVLGDLRWRLLFVPWTAGRFTLEGYTLLSPAHVFDLANLLLLLVPFLLLFGGEGREERPAGEGRDPALAFLGVLAASTFGVAALVDPKLGMARDQDLLSFVGPPVAALVLIRRVGPAPTSRVGPFVWLAVALSALTLFPRVATLRNEERAYSQLARYLDLDRVRGRNGRKLLVERWERAGRTDLADEEALRWSQDYPERNLVLNGRELDARGETDAATEAYLEAIRRNPQYFDPYNNLATIRIEQHRPEEAYELLEVARALAPDEISVLTNLGVACVQTKRFDEAERAFTRVRDLRPDRWESARNLARLAEARGDRAAYREWLRRAADAADAPVNLLLEYAALLHQSGAADLARPYAERAYRLGVDEGTAEALRVAFPGIER
ncbi:MAG: tetratricopeptide repeat protein [bacterium]